MSASKPSKTPYTEEQKNNLLTYGWCWTCLAPRELRMWTTEKDGKTEARMSLVCPNGHPQ